MAAKKKAMKGSAGVGAGARKATTKKNMAKSTATSKTAARQFGRRPKAPQRAFARSKKPLLVLGRGDGRPNRAAGGSAG